MASTVTVGAMFLTKSGPGLDALPDELLLQILGHLDYPFLLALSRVRSYQSLLWLLLKHFTTGVTPTSFCFP